VAALDLDTGKTLWLTNTIREPVMPTRVNYKGIQLWGPSGVSVWTTQTLDVKRRRIYVGTGDSHSDPPAATSDSILALDMDTGTIVWSHQVTVGDASCDLPDRRDCPIANGPDFDFQQPPILVNIDKRQRLLVAGQKSGIVYGFDPDDGGREVWRLRVGAGGPLGGVNWGSAVDGDVMYVAVSDHALADNKTLNPNAGGLVAIRLKDGQQLWRNNVSACAERADCSKAQSAPVTAIPGVVFSGSLDGHLRAYAKRDGQVVWDFDTVRNFQTTNGVSAKGGSIDVGGPAVAGGMVLTTSGYAEWGGMPGNVLLAFSVDGR
jgi:polyvinyl alcohol dehydrogenase (cytochrome)